MRRRPPRQPAADQHAALRRVLDRVRDEVLQQPAQQPAVRAHRARARHEGELEALLARERGELDLELAHQLVDAEARNLRPHRAGIEPRDVEQRAEDFLHRLERGIDVRDEARVLAAALALDQAGDVEPRGVERLQDVVARGGEEARLGKVRFLGLALGARERGVEPGQLLGALLDAPLEVLVGALQRLGGLDARRDVGRGGDEPAVRHVVGADLDHQPALGEALLDRLRAGEIARDALVHEVVDPAGAERALLGVVAQDLVEPDADAGERGRQVEDLAELPVPADELQVLVEHRDALAHVIERGLQDFAVVLDRRIGVVEQLQRGLGGDGPLAQQQRQHEARGGRADRRGEDMLGVAQQVDVRLVLGIEADAAARREALERRGGALLAEIARDRLAQLLDRHGRAPQPEARRHLARVRPARTRWPAGARSRSARARPRTSDRRAR